MNPKNGKFSSFANQSKFQPIFIHKINDYEF